MTSGGAEKTYYINGRSVTAYDVNCWRDTTGFKIEKKHYGAGLKGHGVPSFAIFTFRDDIERHLFEAYFA